MAELELHNPEFDIVINLDGQSKTITVKPDETSDGVEYFVCKSGDEQITQIRLDEDQKWEQLWGELSDEEVAAIGEAIEQKK
ncbi:hypothetical protein SAMN06265348_109140 [Pedobacter westerhofensis]|uniref:DUF1292 domain-containing protein n=1 Tax=Pedobacter westerhofensis TaxID=425512 RepID=A0A521EU95_9SPHI|nr:hypothetical protein [Pedobacter westerhofensis]SMO87518.1 hypothetical protein SAMN06265348_109140 [Pedobacter westerhofensis]